MPVLFDRLYPRKDDATEAVSLLTDDQIRDSIISKREAGKTWREACAETLSAATGDQDRPAARVLQIFKRIKEDVAALRAVDALEYEAHQEFVAALNAVSSVVPVSDWIDHLQDAYEIPPGTAAERFAALKAKLTPEV